MYYITRWSFCPFFSIQMTCVGKQDSILCTMLLASLGRWKDDNKTGFAVNQRLLWRGVIDAVIYVGCSTVSSLPVASHYNCRVAEPRHKHKTWAQVWHVLLALRINHRWLLATAGFTEHPLLRKGHTLQLIVPLIEAHTAFHIIMAYHLITSPPSCDQPKQRECFSFCRFQLLAIVSTYESWSLALSLEKGGQGESESLQGANVGLTL